MIFHLNREAILIEESDYYPVFDDSDRSEFMFRLF